MAKKQFKKKNPKPRQAIDKKQNKRLKALEGFVYKTIENKQINFQTNTSVTSTGYSEGGFLSMSTGASDGTVINGASRIGNSVTLMKQEINANLTLGYNFAVPGGSDAINQLRILVVECMDGPSDLLLSDILLYSSYASYGDQVFVSPYTTKVNTAKRYKIHYDRVWNLNLYKDVTKQMKAVIKYRENGSSGKVVTYEGAGMGQPNNHRLRLLAISDSSVTPHPSMNYSIRSTYKDA